MENQEILNLNEIKENKVPYKVNECCRKIVRNIYQYLKERLILPNPLESEMIIKKEVCAATGLGLSTIYKLDLNNKNPANIISKKINRKRPTTDVSDENKAKIRKIIYEFPEKEQHVLTMKSLHHKLKNELNFTGCVSSLIKIVKELGFKYVKSRNNRKLLIERVDIREKRLKFLRKIKQFREENRPIVYLDETYCHASHSVVKRWDDETNESLKNPISKGMRFIIVHAGCDQGFIEGAELVFKSGCKTGDYHDDMNYENYSKWVKNQLVVNVPPNSVIVKDNAPYHNKIKDRAPNSNSTKDTMKQWLRDHEIEFDDKMLKVELYRLVLANKERFLQFEIDEIFEQNGHTVLRLPPYHPDLNPIEMVWGIIKYRIGQKNVDFDAKKLQDLIHSEINSITKENWFNSCRKVVDQENFYLAKELDNEDDFPISDEFSEEIATEFEIE